MNPTRGAPNYAEYSHLIPSIILGVHSHPLIRCVRQLDLAPFDLLFWLHPLVSHHSAPGRSEALRRP